MRIAVVGSGFITPAIFKEELTRELGEYEVQELLLPWPGVTRRRDDEIQEYVGGFDEVIETARHASALVTDLAPVNEYILAQLPDLKMIGVARGGPVNVNVEAATRRGIPVVNAPGRNGVAAAEFTVAMILSIVRRLGEGQDNLRRGLWQGDLYRYETSALELQGRTAGLVGLGQVGGRVAKILEAFGMKVLAYDPFLDESAMKAVGVTPASLQELLTKSDVVSLHARLTKDTRGMVGAEQLALMKPSAILINTARAGILDYAALSDALVAGRLGGAGLDVYDNEPPNVADPMYALPTVLSQPHVGGATQESARRGASMVAVDVRRYLVEGIDPLHCKNKEVLTARR
jgi:D-3-phosphoglycerate dehydrogenase